MIVSASRRTDIPAFYTEWFLNRLRAGYVIVQNPLNAHQFSIVPLNKNDVECYVFWSKNPQPMLDHIDEIESLVGRNNFYFQFTLNGYDRSIEPKVPPLSTRIRTFKSLSDRIGPERVIWRYDPVLVNDRFTVEWHKGSFEYLAEQLHEYTKKCVFSFVDGYQITIPNRMSLDMENPSGLPEEEIASSFSESARKYNLNLATCCEKIDLDRYGILHNKCIDDDLISKITGRKIIYKRDSDPKSKRAACGCMKCKDIGTNNTCRHFCLYCYANKYTQSKPPTEIDIDSPILGNLDMDSILSDENNRFYCNSTRIDDPKKWMDSQKTNVKDYWSNFESR